MFDRENAGCTIEENGKILTIYRTNRNHLETPGGGIEVGESLETAALRETKEEIGIDVELGNYLGYIDFETAGKRIRSHHFAAKIPKGKIPFVAEPQLFNAIVWVPLYEWEKFPCSPNTKKFCENYCVTGKLELPNVRERRI